MFLTMAKSFIFQCYNIENNSRAKIIKYLHGRGNFDQKMAITSERNELLNSNKCPIVPFSETIHLIPSLTNLVDI